MDTNNQTVQKSNGALIGSIIIIIILIIGGVYILKTKVSSDKATEDAVIQQQQMDQQKADNLSNSDDLDSIDADLHSNANVDGMSGGAR